MNDIVTLYQQVTEEMSTQNVDPMVMAEFLNAVGNQFGFDIVEQIFPVLKNNSTYDTMYLMSDGTVDYD